MAEWHQYRDKSQIFQANEKDVNFLCLYIDINKWQKSFRKLSDNTESLLSDYLFHDQLGHCDIEHVLELSETKNDDSTMLFLRANQEAITHEVSFVVCNIQNLEEELDSTLKESIFVNQLRPENPSQLERNFKNIKSNNYAGVAFGIEDITKGYVALARKFDLKVLVTSVKHDRHMQKAQNCNVDEMILI